MISGAETWKCCTPPYSSSPKLDYLPLPLVVIHESTSKTHANSIKSDQQEKQPYRCSNEGITGRRSQCDLQTQAESWLRFKSWKGSILLYAEILMGINTCTVFTTRKSAKVDTLQLNGSMYMCSLHRNAHSLSCSIPKEMHFPVPPMQWNYKAGHQRSSSLKVCNAHYTHTHKVDMRSSRKKNLPRWI